MANEHFCEQEETECSNTSFHVTGHDVQRQIRFCALILLFTKIEYMGKIFLIFSQYTPFF